MAWRTVLVSGRAKLDLKMNSLVIRKEEVFKIHISEIAILIIESKLVSITTALIGKLIEEKVKIIFCDGSHNPIGEIANYYNKHNCVKQIKTQLKWDDYKKQLVWSEIIKEKINKQSRLLAHYEIDKAAMLNKYYIDIKLGDSTNREGHAAKVYFFSLFGKGFIRGNDDPINNMLDYGYSIILSIFNREIVANGYLTQLGIFHDNQFNYFNLSSDFMEPIRPLIDKIVYDSNLESFTSLEKREILKIFKLKFYVDNKNCSLINAISLYCKSLFEALEKGDISLIKFIDYEL